MNVHIMHCVKKYYTTFYLKKISDLWMKLDEVLVLFCASNTESTASSEAETLKLLIDFNSFSLR